MSSVSRMMMMMIGGGGGERGDEVTGRGRRGRGGGCADAILEKSASVTGKVKN